MTHSPVLCCPLDERDEMQIHIIQLLCRPWHRTLATLRDTLVRLLEECRLVERLGAFDACHVFGVVVELRQERLARKGVWRGGVAREVEQGMEEAYAAACVADLTGPIRQHRYPDEKVPTVCLIHHIFLLSSDVSLNSPLPPSCSFALASPSLPLLGKSKRTANTG